MKVIPPTYQEIAFKQCQRLLMLNPLMMSGYYTALFNTFKSLLIEEDIQQLDAMIVAVEERLSDDYNQMTLQEAELRMFNNMDLLSGFEVGGKMVTQMEINQWLEEIKSWLTQRLYAYLPHIRFTTPVKME